MWLDTQESWWGSSSRNAKAVEPELEWSKSQLQDRTGERSASSAPGQGDNCCLLIFCSVRALTDWLVPAHTGESNLLDFILFISSGSVPTDTPRNDVYIWLISDIWASGGPVRLTPKINPHTFIWKFSITPATISLQLESRPLFIQSLLNLSGKPGLETCLYCLDYLTPCKPLLLTRINISLTGLHKVNLHKTPTTMFDTSLDHKKYFFPPVFHPCYTCCHNYFDMFSGSNTYFFFPLIGTFAFILTHSFTLMHFLKESGLLILSWMVSVESDYTGRIHSSFQ